MVIDLLGHFGYILIFLGMIGIRYKNPYGWALRFLGELVWVSIGFQLGLTSIWIWGLVFMLVDFWAFVQWQDEVEEKPFIPLTEEQLRHRDYVEGQYGD